VLLTLLKRLLAAPTTRLQISSEALLTGVHTVKRGNVSLE
jgi:hypothetical protein